MFSDLRLIYSSNERMECIFSTLVVRTWALRVNYNGGLRRFLEKHDQHARCNRKIMVLFAMGDCYIREPVEDLLDHGFESGKDFAWFDATNLFWAPGQQIDIGVDWLQAVATERGMVVSFSPQINKRWQSK